MTERPDPAQFYSRRYHLFGDTPQAFDWSSRTSQVNRFKVLTNIGALDGKSLLDVGCGTGDLYLYLKERGISCDYHGCDLIPEFIEEARRKTPGTYYQGDFLAVDFDRRFEYVLCSGMLNLLVKSPVGAFSATQDMAFAMIEKMAGLATLAVGVNFRSSLARPAGNGVVAYDPSQVLAHCLARYGASILLDHSYLPHDFTVFLYKAR